MLGTFNIVIIYYMRDMIIYNTLWNIIFQLFYLNLLILICPHSMIMLATTTTLSNIFEIYDKIENSCEGSNSSLVYFKNNCCIHYSRTEFDDQIDY